MKQTVVPTEEDPAEHRALTVGDTYFVLGVSVGFYRLIDDQGEPILYPKRLFEVLDRTIPAGFELSDYDDGDYYLDPSATAVPGFYEAWHDPVVSQKTSDARATFRATVEQMRAHVDEIDRALLDRDLARLR